MADPSSPNGCDESPSVSPIPSPSIGSELLEESPSSSKPPDRGKRTKHLVDRIRSRSQKPKIEIQARAPHGIARRSSCKGSCRRNQLLPRYLQVLTACCAQPGAVDQLPGIIAQPPPALPIVEASGSPAKSVPWVRHSSSSRRPSSVRSSTHENHPPLLEPEAV